VQVFLIQNRKYKYARFKKFQKLVKLVQLSLTAASPFNKRDLETRHFLCIETMQCRIFLDHLLVEDWL
ncbi:MAG: hypothetical protein WBF33_05965, partial [Candidatus Nitrosopolaris sp.]